VSSYILVERFDRNFFIVKMQNFGEVKIAEDEDFNRLRDLCQNHDGWKQVYNKNECVVWTRTNDVSDFNIVKVVNQLQLQYKSICNYLSLGL